jgi:hypothetical protein
LSKKITNNGVDPLSFVRCNVNNSIFLRNTDVKEVETIIKTLKEASPGIDGIHSKVIKATYHKFISPLTHIFNLSLSQGFFPNEMKIAKVVPLFKSGDSQHVTNYRPVSILPLFSKMFEKLMFNRLHNFIESNNLIYEYQFGFRTKYSTNLALIILIDKILSAIDSGNLVIGVFLDLKKAFDTVNHNILLNKLQKYGIRGKALDWLTDYLRDRKQYVCVI